MRKQVDLLDEVFASGYVRDYSLAVDGGANVGDWTAKLLEQFNIVYAYDASDECVGILQERFREERERNEVVVVGAALMAQDGRVRLISPNKKRASQKRYVEIDEAGDVDARTIDGSSHPFCGLIKLDLEGAEGLALLGARRTIERFRPVLIVEFFRDYSLRYGHTEAQVMEMIRSMGYREVLSSFPDKVFVHEN